MGGSTISILDGSSHGFVFDGTSYVPVDVPGSNDTAATGIDGGRIVGTYVDAAGLTHGFVTIPEPSCGLTVLFAAGALIRRPRRTSAA